MTGRIVARLPIEVATFLLNEKREGVFDIEKRTGVQIILVPDPAVILPNYAVERVREEDQRHDPAREASYELTTEADATPAFATQPAAPADEPAVKVAPPSAPPPPARPSPPAGTPRKAGLLTRLRTLLFGGSREPAPPPSSRTPSRPGRHGARRDSTGRGRRDGVEPRRRGGATRGGESHPGHGEGRRRRGARTPPAAEAEAAASEHDVSTSEDSAAPGGEGRSRSARRGNRRGRRGGSRNRGREGARAVAGDVEAADAPRPDTPGAAGGRPDPTETEATTAPTGIRKARGHAGAGSATRSDGGAVETEATAPAGTREAREHAGAGSATRSDGGNVETGNAAVPAASGPPPETDHDPVRPVPAARAAPGGARSRAPAVERSDAAPPSTADKGSAGQAGAPPRRSVETDTSAETAGG